MHSGKEAEKNDYGSKIQIKCHDPISRIDETLDGQKCANWETVDSFGIQLNTSVNFPPLRQPVTLPHLDEPEPPFTGMSSVYYSDFYRRGLPNDRSLRGEKGFMLTGKTFHRFEPIGVIWNDTYCRRITNEGSLGCFVETDIDIFQIAKKDFPENNCTGSGQ